MAVPESMSSAWARPYWSNERVVTVQWELSERCNFRCPHCYLSLKGRSGAYSANDISFGDALGVLDDLVELGTLFVTFTGGEVFLYPQFLDLCSAARERGLGVKILTNGSRIGPEEARRLAQLGVRSVEVTVYAASRDGYRRMTGDAGAFRAVVRGLRLLQRYRVPVVLKTFYSRVNADEAEGIEAVARRLGLTLRRSSALVPRVTDWVLPRAGLTRTQAGRIASLLGDPSWANHFDQKLEASLCGWCGRSRLFVAANGDVTPCNSTRYVVLGNRRKRSIAEIWRRPEVQATLRSLDREGKPWKEKKTLPP